MNHTKGGAYMTKQKEEVELMRVEFRAVLIAILDYLKHGETQRAIQYINSILNDK